MQGWDDPVKWDSLPQGGMARSWDTPAKLGQPSQTGTTQPNWDSPAAWDVPHRVGRPNRLGCPMQMWDDSVVDHPTTSLGHTTQAGTSHTNWADPIFSRLLRSDFTNACNTCHEVILLKPQPAAPAQVFLFSLVLIDSQRSVTKRTISDPTGSKGLLACGSAQVYPEGRALHVATSRASRASSPSSRAGRSTGQEALPARP